MIGWRQDTPHGGQAFPGVKERLAATFRRTLRQIGQRDADILQLFDGKSVEWVARVSACAATSSSSRMNSGDGIS
jgi:hypothetical protein